MSGGWATMEVKSKINFEFLLYTEFDWLIGLTLLLPVIINSRSNWSETKLRIFCTASGVQELEDEKKGLV
jgi:hypothetical protein